MSVCAVVGGQFGSEGKGLIVGHIARQYNNHVRVGAANAGHTLYTSYQEPFIGAGPNPLPTVYEKHVMQQIPCAAYANPDARLLIGPGALITNSIFQRELEKLVAWREERGLGELELIIDPRAHFITEEHIEREEATDLQERIGSTSATAREGIGAAQAARVMREATCVRVSDVLDEIGRFGRFQVADVSRMLGIADSVLLEGTQGTGLSLTTGYFPYVTSRNTTVAGLCADVGIAPQRVDRTILVCRTFPIRVAGASGPFHPSSIERMWEQLGVDPENERTTVTKKVRRVATFSLEQVVESVILNGATEIALTFCDYIAPRLAGVTDKNEFDTDADEPLLELIHDIETYTGVPVTMLGTGPHSVVSWEN